MFFKADETLPLALNEVSIIPEVEGQVQNIEYQNPLYKGPTRFENPLYEDPPQTTNVSIKSKFFCAIGTLLLPPKQRLKKYLGWHW